MTRLEFGNIIVVLTFKGKRCSFEILESEIVYRDYQIFLGKCSSIL